MTMTMTADEVLHELLATPQGHADPYPYYRLLLAQAPFHHSGLDSFWYASSYQTCRQLLLDPRLGHDRERPRRRYGLSEAQLRRFERRRRRGLSMVTENPPEHTRLRGLAKGAFTPRRIEALRARIVELTDGFLERMADLRRVDVMAELAFPLPVTVIGELVGVPAQDRERFRPLVGDMLADESEMTEEDLEQADRASEEMQAFFAGLIAERRSRPANDLLSDLIKVRDDEGRLSEEELVATVSLLFFAGFVTTTNLIGNGLLALLQHPAELARLWADGGLVTTAVEEMLRYDSPVQLLIRTVLEPVAVANVQLRPGESVIALVGAANRDPERFADPDRFDVGRRDNQPLSFGAGIHHCLGAPLARLEGQVVFGRLRERFASIELLDGDPARTSGLLRGLRSLPVQMHPPLDPHRRSGGSVRR
jgi:cytochrome P450